MVPAQAYLLEENSRQLQGTSTSGSSGVQDRGIFLDEAVAIANQILDHRVSTKTATPAFFGPKGYGTELSPLKITNLGPHLYDGTTGIALFFAALGYITNRSEYIEVGLQTLAPLRKKLKELLLDPERAEQLQLPIGGLIGLGSFIYSFLRIGTWLSEASLLHEAHEATALITTKRISQDRYVRTQAGSAGAVLALLALQEACPRANKDGRRPIEIASECARHLIETRLSYQSRPRAWPLSPGKPPLLGFSYGAAGISYALFRLYEKTLQPELLEVAEEGMAYVRSFYLPEHKVWLDVRAMLRAQFDPPSHLSWGDWWLSGKSDLSMLIRKDVSTQESQPDLPPEEQILANKWCHGAPGIALSRIGALHLLDTPEIQDEIAGALSETRSFAQADKFAEHTPDDLCCGHMGRVEALLYAYQHLGDERLLSDAQVLARRVIHRSRDRGSYGVTASRGTECFSPSLFQGYAGIGYTLLRLTRPDALPSLLLLE